MVDIKVRSLSPGGTVVNREPSSTAGIAVAADRKVGSVTIEDGLTGVALARDGDPVGEEGAGI
jgi:hypothetical protein